MPKTYKLELRSPPGNGQLWVIKGLPDRDPDEEYSEAERAFQKKHPINYKALGLNPKKEKGLWGLNNGDGNAAGEVDAVHSVLYDLHNSSDIFEEGDTIVMPATTVRRWHTYDTNAPTFRVPRTVFKAQSVHIERVGEKPVKNQKKASTKKNPSAATKALLKDLRAAARGAIQYNDEVRQIMPHDYSALHQLVRRPASAYRSGEDVAYLQGGSGTLSVKFRHSGGHWLVETYGAFPNAGFESDYRKGVTWTPLLINAAGVAVNAPNKNPGKKRTRPSEPRATARGTATKRGLSQPKLGKMKRAKAKKNPTHAFGEIDRARARRIVKLAAKGIRASMPKAWLNLDERGTWEKEALKHLNNEQLQAKAAELNMREKEVDAQIATMLGYYATAAALEHAKKRA